MDLKITDLAGKSAVFSSFGATTLTFYESPAESERTSKSFAGRNGKLDYGGRYTSKKITAKVMYEASSFTEDQNVQQKINALLGDSNGYYVQLADATKRFLVYRKDTNLPEVVGKSLGKYTSTWEFEFETKELPFGESLPRNQELKAGDQITYQGTVKNSQLEQSFYFVVMVNEDSSTGFDLSVGDHNLKVNVAIKKGDKVVLAGINNTQNGTNINNLTNYDYFELLPNGPNQVTCTIDAAITLKNVKDLFL